MGHRQVAMRHDALDGTRATPPPLSEVIFREQVFGALKGV
jgi:hypothetical protein